MKWKYLFACTMIGNLAFAQPKQLPASASAANEKALAGYFNSNKVQLLSSIALSVNKGLLIVYEKADTLNFDHAFFKPENGRARDYIRQGLALYQKRAHGYVLRFANPQALFCASCNNMHGYDIAERNDTLNISISWGPSAFPTNDTYRFVYNISTGKWRAVSTLVSGIDDNREERRTYLEYKTNAGIDLSNYVAELMPYNPVEPKVAKSIKLYYRPGNYQNLLDSLYKVPQAGFSLLSQVFSASDAEAFITAPITKKDVENANNIGYFLEQVNALPAAEVFLKKVIEAFPEREVAWYNLGDVYRRKGMKSQALSYYNTYVSLMNKKGQQDKIPQRVKEYINRPQTVIHHPQ